MRKILAGLAAIVVLAGCQKGTLITYSVINNSGEQITFTSYYHYNTSGTNSSIVNTGDTRDILILSKSDGTFDEGYKAGTGIDSIVGISNTGKRVMLKMTEPATWSQITTKKQHLHTFTTEVKPKDLK